MKKIKVLILAMALILTFSNTVLAANNVSEMAVNKGGQHVAECAQSMEKGISQCLQMIECLN